MTDFRQTRTDGSRTEATDPGAPGRDAGGADAARPHAPPSSWWPAKHAILAPNHLSMLDGPVVARTWSMACSGRADLPLLFGVDPDYSLHPFWARVMRSACRLWNADFVPIGRGNPFGLRRMLDHLGRAGVVCLFPSGAIGSSERFRGAEFLSQRSGAPLYDVHLRYRIGHGRYALTEAACSIPAGRA